ncbi:MAG: hypothetical protein NTV55_09760 [Planctomycetota bacterium]|nr:hypothetical protein [Planctomycetota bacterium]
MSIWDVVGNVLEKKQSADNEDKPDKDKKPPLIATTFTANFGDTITTLMGGGRFTNLIGSDAKVVFDWEEAVKDGFSKIPGVGKVLEGKVISAFMGLGGDAGMVYGNKTAFHYSGIPFTSRRGGNPSVAFSDTVKGKNIIGANDATAIISERKSVYFLVGVGIAAIVALSVTVRLRYSNFPMNKDKTELETEDDEVAKNLICDSFVICEDRWLLLLRHLDIGFQMAFLLGNAIKVAEISNELAIKELKLKQKVLSDLNAKPTTVQTTAEIDSIKAVIVTFKAEADKKKLAYDNRYIHENINLKCYFE